jgi:large subunit ribosomal protein L17
MRHLVKGHKIGRSASHRKATLQALSTTLIKEHRIKTTVAKAKALRPFLEPLITRAKVDSTHNRRIVFSKLNNKKAVSLLFDEIAVKAKNRPGGYTRVIKIGARKGDGAETALIELVDYNDIKPDSKSSRSGTRRSGS